MAFLCRINYNHEEVNALNKKLMSANVMRRESIREHFINF